MEFVSEMSFVRRYRFVFVLFVAIDPICDMFRTTVLVAGNNALAALACGREQASR